MKKLKLLLPLLLLCPFMIMKGQIVVEEEPKMLYYEWTHERVRKLKDLKDFRDVFHKDKFLMGKKRIMGNISYNTGRVLIDDGSEVHSEMRSALGFYGKVRFFEEFSINATIYKDFNPRAAARWTSDFNYAIGRYHWKPNKFNYGYENYVNNKFSDDAKTLGRKFMEGHYFVSYSRAPRKLNRAITIDSSTYFKLTAFTRYAIKYRDEFEITHGGLFEGKPTLGLGFRYTILWNIYIESAVYYYPVAKQQAPWDPDYSYGFGYFDWRSFRLSFTYGNWAINRFPWNKQTRYPGYGFYDGNFRIVANWWW
jgi:hypothetical protein